MCFLWSRCFFPNNETIFEDNNMPIHTARSVQSWFEEDEDSLKHLWLAQLKYHQTSVVSFREQGEKQIPFIISQTTRGRVEQYSARDYSDLT